MIEVTFVQAVGTLVGAFSVGIGLGYKVGEKKVVTKQETYCSVWSKNHQGNITIILMNSKRVNNNCPEYSQSKKLCRLNGQKCKLID